MSKIDFDNITQTLDGFDCHYFGTRESFGSTLYCFGVFHPGMGVHELAYDAAGKRLRFENGSWVESTATSYQIAAPPKIVEVTRWIGYYWDKEKGDVCTDFYIQAYPDAERAYLKLLEITESIEVPG